MFSVPWIVFLLKCWQVEWHKWIIEMLMDRFVGKGNSYPLDQGNLLYINFTYLQVQMCSNVFFLHSQQQMFSASLYLYQSWHRGFLFALEMVALPWSQLGSGLGAVLTPQCLTGLHPHQTCNIWELLAQAARNLVSFWRAQRLTCN